jgi:hypothetical protein
VPVELPKALFFSFACSCTWHRVEVPSFPSHFTYHFTLQAVVSFVNLKFNISGFHLVSDCPLPTVSFCTLLHHPSLPAAKLLIFGFKFVELQ